MTRYVHRCPACRTRRHSQKLMQAHMRDSGHAACWCGGYHYKHRPGSPYCHHNPLSPIREAARQTDDEDVIRCLAFGVADERPDLADQVRELCARFGIKLQPQEEERGNCEVV